MAQLLMEEFADVLCSDPDWVRAEFDDLLATVWPAASSRDPITPRCPAPSAGQDDTTGPVGFRPTWRGRHPGADGWAHQRSPPTVGYGAMPRGSSKS